MLPIFQDLEYGTYGFRLKGLHQKRVAGIYSLGWEKQTSPTYDWDGLTRSEKDIIVFQYTLRGTGEIKINDHTHKLNNGDAFFVKIPSNHRYYLPASSEGWEFIHLTLYGQEAEHTIESITNELGQVFHLDLHSSPISIIFKLLRDVSKRKITDAYEASARAFLFLMELHRFALNIENKTSRPDPINKAIVFIDNNYANPISLDDIVGISGLSKYHFTRIFDKSIHLTPMQYLKKVRINKSIELLKNESLTIEEVAISVGFPNGNYFSKVFKSSLGLPPGEFRNSKTVSPIDHLVGDH